MVKQAASADEFRDLVKAGTVVVDFTATWCKFLFFLCYISCIMHILRDLCASFLGGPCKMIGPFFEELSNKYINVKFLKVDVDELDELASELGVSAMPSFYVYKDGKVAETLVGASKDKLEALIAKFN
jgi:thioredoxin 1